MIETILFDLFAIVAVTAAVMVITLNNPVHCALFLVTAFVSSAAIWILAQAEFLALILLLVYVGAVMTLFLFVIMMLDVNDAPRPKRFVRYFPLGIGVVGLLVFLLLWTIYPTSFNTVFNASNIHPSDYSSVAALGRVLYTQYAYPFELAAVLLLVAIISAISLAHRTTKRSKTQHPVDQMRVTSGERLKLVSMEAERDPS